MAKDSFFMIQLLTKASIASYYSPRAGEEKIGDTIQFCDYWNVAAIAASEAHFVLLGIPEDIGVVANNGIAGAATVWDAFLASFLNIQSNTFLRGKDILLLGKVDMTSITDVATLDDVVSDVLDVIVAADKIPIVIGGGHNNAFPIIRSVSKGCKESINIINLDPHADIRTMEKRHSGNGFSFAKAAQFLDRYALLGLHQQYNNQYMIDELKRFDYVTVWWEDIFLSKKYTWDEAVHLVKNVAKTKNYGVELDIDAIENALSSAITPVGVTPQQAMYYLYEVANNENAAYLHIAEGVHKRADGQENHLTGKLISYLVQAFIKGKLKSFLRT